MVGYGLRSTAPLLKEAPLQLPACQCDHTSIYIRILQSQRKACFEMASKHPNITVRGSKGTSPKGRTLHATKAFQAGELITDFTKPILTLPNGPSSKSICNHCLAQNVHTRACTGCRAVVYCSPACQKANWTLVHKKECRAFLKVRQSVGKDWLPTPVRALVQVLLRWGDHDVRTAFEGLEGNVGHFKQDENVWEDIGLQACGGLTYAGRPELDAELNLARDILCKV